MNVYCLGSGSSGNAFLVATEHGCIAVDCGVTVRRFSAVLQEIGKSLDLVDALLISHEHVDHVKSLNSFRRRSVPIYATEGTLKAMRLVLDQPPLKYWKAVSAGGFTITPLPVQHDAAEPCGFLIRSGSAAVAIVSDIGVADHVLLDPLAACNLVVIEANHDLEMLWNGPYPAQLKRRVASARGHLSNADCAEFLERLQSRSSVLGEIWLAHLSEQNNHPEIALARVSSQLNAQSPPVVIRALPRFGPVVAWHAAGTSRPIQIAMDL